MLDAALRLFESHIRGVDHILADAFDFVEASPSPAYLRLEAPRDAPFPAPVPEVVNSRPETIPLNTRPIKARHYGRNIESIIDLIASEPEGEIKTAMIRSLAIYMRQQYLIWNKDTVADRTIFQDIERLSGGRVTVPEGLELSKLSADANFARPGMNLGFGNRPGGNGNRNKYGRKNGKKR